MLRVRQSLDDWTPRPHDPNARKEVFERKPNSGSCHKSYRRDEAASKRIQGVRRPEAAV